MSWHGLIVALAAALCAGCGVASTAAPATPTKPAWREVWADEFDGDDLSASRWSVEDHSTFGDGNGELACLLNRPENVRVRDGVMRLRAVREPKPRACRPHDNRFPTGRRYTSAMVSTKGRADWLYGRFEVRAKLPTQQGTSKGIWPALWMRPTQGGNGELDVFEAIGSSVTRPEAPQVHQTIWFDYQRTHPKQAHAARPPSGSPSDGFHVYALDWARGSVRWYIDGRLTYTRDRTTTPWLDEAFGRPLFLRLNLAVGGTWPGEPDASSAFPADYLVDYVRVYQHS